MVIDVNKFDCVYPRKCCFVRDSVFTLIVDVTHSVSEFTTPSSILSIFFPNLVCFLKNTFTTLHSNLELQTRPKNYPPPLRFTMPAPLEVPTLPLLPLPVPYQFRTSPLMFQIDSTDNFSSPFSSIR